MMEDNKSEIGVIVRYINATRKDIKVSAIVGCHDAIQVDFLEIGSREKKLIPPSYYIKRFCEIRDVLHEIDERLALLPERLLESE